MLIELIVSHPPDIHLPAKDHMLFKPVLSDKSRILYGFWDVNSILACAIPKKHIDVGMKGK